MMYTMDEFFERQEKAQKYQDSMTEEDQIKYLKTYKKSVFTAYFKDGTKKIDGDSESNQEEMKKFFDSYPPEGIDRIVFHK